MTNEPFCPVTKPYAAIYATPGTWLWMAGGVRIVAERRIDPGHADGDRNMTLWFAGDPQGVLGDTGQTVYVIEDRDQPGLREFMVAQGYRLPEEGA